MACNSCIFQNIHVHVLDIHVCHLSLFPKLSESEFSILNKNVKASFLVYIYGVSVCLFLTGLGMVMYYTGILIDGAHTSDNNSEYYKEEKENDNLIEIPSWFAMEFAGALIATVFMVWY